MSETLIKLLRVYLGDEEPSTLHRFDKRIAMQPEVDDFYDFLCQQYHEGHIEYWLETYEDMVKQRPDDPIMYFNVAMVCVAWSRELEGDHISSKSSHGAIFEDWLRACLTNWFSESGRNPGPASGEGFMGQAPKCTDYREFFSMRHRAASCLERIVEMNPELSPDIVAGLLANIADLRHLAGNQSEF